MPQLLPTATLIVLVCSSICLARSARAEVGGDEGTAAPVLSSGEPAPYPEGGQGAARVVVALVVDETGAVVEAQVVEGAEAVFDEAALAAARAFRFSPARVEGVAVRARIEMPFDFEPPEQPRATAAPELPPLPVDVPEPEPLGRVEGAIVEQGSRDPVAGAQVEAGGRQTGTDESGRFELAVEPGVVEVVIACDGYRSTTVRTRVVAGRTRRFTVTLDRASTAAVYETVVRDRPYPEETTRVTLSGPELRTVPGTGGNPLRVIENLPSVLPVMSMLPYYFVRGAPPAATGYFLDGIRLPALYHLGIGQPVVHPALIERVDFFPGGAPAEMGWLVGGVLRATSRRIRGDRIHAEWEAGISEVNGLVQVPINDTLRVSVSGRYSFLGYWLKALSPGLGLSTGDYQARMEWDVAPGHRLSMLALGAYSGLSYSELDGGGDDLDFKVHFHRVVARYQLLPRRGLQIDVRVWFGFDETGLSAGRVTQMWATGPQASLRWRPLPWLEVLAGAELEYRWFPGISNIEWDDDFGSYFQERDALLAGSYLSLVLHPTEATDVTMGARFDVHAVDDDTKTWVDLRFSYRHRFTPVLALHGALGTYHQPQAFIIQLPGFGSVPLDVPPQESLQLSQGVEVSLPWALRLDVQLFHTTFDNLSEPDPTATGSEGDFASWLGGESGLGALTGRAYGLELQLRRRLGEDIFGWVSYTLSRSERDYSTGRAPHDFDQTHTLSVVASWYIGWGYRVGARVQVSSGRPYTPRRCEVDPERPFSPPSECVEAGGYNSSRLPPFFRLDLRMDKEWTFRLWGLALFLEAWNVTFTREALGASCDCEEEGGQYAMFPPFPLIGLQLGIRGVY